ncbi:MAG: hypothetical protein IJS58_07485 [Bacilli bacterium]|nr:hypothetical protein [Bacilli bacterium]
MNKTMRFKLFSVLVILMLSLCLLLVGCNDDPDDPVDPDDPGTEIDWDSKTIDHVEVDSVSFGEEYDIDDFKLEDLKMHVYYTDGMDRLVPCTRDMFDDGDYDKLANPGTKKVIIYFGDEEFEAKIYIVDYALYDEDLNRKKEYDAVIKAIRKDNKLEFILESENNFAGVQAKYVFDKDKFNMTNFKVSDTADSYGNFEVKDGELYISFMSAKNLKGEVVLFSCDISGDFRHSGLTIDENYANRAYGIGEESTERLFKILYHVSKK